MCIRDRANTDLAKGYGDNARGPNDMVIYNGARIRTLDLPPRSFYQPQVADVYKRQASPGSSNSLNVCAATRHDAREAQS